MKRGGELKRKTPMARGTSKLTTKKPLRSTTPLTAGAARPRTPKSKKRKVTVRRQELGGDSAMLEACRGQECYLKVPGIHPHNLDSVVPCHSNQQKHGKGMGLKARDEFTVPGCGACHAELDQGMRFTKAEKFAIWDRAFALWKPVRDQLLVRKC